MVSMIRLCTILVGWVLLYMTSTLAVAQPAWQHKEFEELQRKYEAAQQEIARLRSTLESLKRERAAAPPPPAAAATPPGDDPLQVGNAHFAAQRYTEAIAAYTKAIEAV